MKNSEVPSDFDLLFESFSFRNRDEENETYDMGRLWHNHQNVWSDMSREQLSFIQSRLACFLQDTASMHVFVYIMGCSHPWNSPYRMSVSSRAHCPEHGFQRLSTKTGLFLPTWKEWLSEHERIAGANEQSEESRFKEIRPRRQPEEAKGSTKTRERSGEAKGRRRQGSTGKSKSAS